MGIAHARMMRPNDKPTRVRSVGDSLSVSSGSVTMQAWSVFTGLALLLAGSMVPQRGSCVGHYSRTASYEGDILVRCPDESKDTVQILARYVDVWDRGVGGSIDFRISRSLFSSIAEHFPECEVVLSDVEAFVQEAEGRMFPSKSLEAWEEELMAKVQAEDGSPLECKEAMAKLMEIESESWFQEYHDYAAIIDWYVKLAEKNPSLVRVVPSIGPSFEGRNIPAVHITASASSETHKVFVTSLVHAREWIGPSVGMFFAQNLVKGYGADTEITKMLKNLEFVFIPVVNPDGYVHTWTVDRLWRKNRNTNGGSGTCIGVDINRNFPTGFEGSPSSKPTGSSSLVCSSVYHGSYAGSEPESMAVMGYYKENAPVVGAVDLHSFGKLLLRPWGWTPAAATEEDIHKNLGQAMSDAAYEVNRVRYQSKTSYDLYKCNGVLSDWLYGNVEENGGYRTLAFTLELRDDSFLLPADQITAAGSEATAALKVFVNYLLESPVQVAHQARSGSSSNSRARGRGWNGNGNGNFPPEGAAWMSSSSPSLPYSSASARGRGGRVFSDDGRKRIGHVYTTGGRQE